ncbi:uncharacterized protein LOC132063452 [Lycium ferocissimum]|uniref:uncharacterized protein LOC132063452 n=1 Tax=Lycium ferocissimum TaxID=112874 RepID=UPI0028165634|nr:uncharacterized protein LOC132063452 [Lycium ferocissimum]
MYNDLWSQSFSIVNVRHLPRTGSDHRILLMKCGNMEPPKAKYFKFLNFWTDQDDFLETVKNSWQIEVRGNPMWIMQQKLKRLSNCLSQWSKNIGNVFDKVKDLEEQILWMNKETVILRQKARIKWQEEGDSNTKYFHSVIRHKRKKSHIYRIKNEFDEWIQGDDRIADAAIRHFNRLFSQPDQFTEFKILDNIEKQVTNEDNENLVAIPIMEETYQAIIFLDPDSALRPDGFNGRFYQATWEIIKDDVHNMVRDFFRGGKLTKFFTHTCLILLPKVDSPSSFSQMRPISLSNIPNKTGFIKGRLITDNVLLTQELVQDIKKNNKYGNIVMKLDMAKAYYKVSWLFLKAAIRKMGFSEIFIDVIHRLISRFAETLSNALNNLHNKERYIGCTIQQKGPLINHLCYADDIVIFSSGNKRTIKMITRILKQYERESGQEINIYNSVFLTATHSHKNRRRMISRITGHKHQFFPVKYLGCPIFPGRKRLSDLVDIAKSVMNKAQGWHGLGPLAIYHHSNPSTLMVTDCLQGDNWDMEYISKLVPPNICDVIQKVDIGQRNKMDQAIWIDNPSGKFTCASAFHALRKRMSESPIWKCIWNKGNSFKMAFISWRIIKNKLPMYDRIKNFSNNSDPMCICCNHPKEETILHVFIEGDLAMKCIPVLICWELWKAWSSVKYGNKKYSKAKICYEVAQYMKCILIKKGYNIDLRDNWSRICSSMEAHKAILTSIPIVWNKPPDNVIKMNTDGSKGSKNKA